MGRDHGTGATAAAASVPICFQSRRTSPLPSGWTRLLRKITAVWLSGSIQSDVPVKPVWPKPVPGRNPSPRLPEYGVRTSQP